MNHQKSRGWRAALPGLTAFLLLLSILAFPKEAYKAALSGLDVFLHSVFPALLPFLHRKSWQDWEWWIFCPFSWIPLWGRSFVVPAAAPLYGS